MSIYSSSYIDNKRSSLRKRARRNGVPFSVSASRLRKILSVRNCPVCGVLLNNEENHPNAKSIDRVVPNLGYTDDNVAVLCRECNTNKANYNLFQLRDKGMSATAAFVKNRLAIESGNKSASIKEEHVTYTGNGEYYISLTKEFRKYFKDRNGLNKWDGIAFKNWLLEIINENNE